MLDRPLYSVRLSVFCVEDGEGVHSRTVSSHPVPQSDIRHRDPVTDHVAGFTFGQVAVQNAIQAAGFVHVAADGVLVLLGCHS